MVGTSVGKAIFTDLNSADDFALLAENAVAARPDPGCNE